ncbi:Malate:quinone oxidoreductase [Ewingella americana]|uniref:Malate:quinone oxidoreductase n=1 Tax=Ewingella americana TaxID=41202 RepID=A0A377N8R1_9GAMM|nr:Malate:quinone oxidoreductase [Ewingella americana]
MSATLGTYLQELEPNWSINMVERLMALLKRVLTAGTTPVRATRHWLR